MSFLRDPKRLIATLIAGVAGLIVLVDFAGAMPSVDQLARIAIDWAALLAALALIVGLLNVSAGHVSRVARRQPDWYYSLVLLVSMVLVIVTGTLVGFVSDANCIVEAAVPIGIGAYGSVRGEAALPPVGTPIELFVAAARPAR